MRYTQNSVCVARYSLAVDRRKSDENTQSADFPSCVAFGRAGEFAEKYLKKGMKILITGHIQTGSYTDRDGKKVYTTDVIVEETEFAEPKRDEAPAQAAAPTTNADGFTEIPDGVEDAGLPFN